MEKNRGKNIEQNDSRNKTKIYYGIFETQNDEGIWSYKGERRYRKWIYSHMSGDSIDPFFEDTIYGE